MPGYDLQKPQYQLVENFDVYLHTKIKFIPHLFLKYCQDIADLLFWVL